MSHLESPSNPTDNELRRHEAVARDDRSGLAGSRPGSWNVVFLGQLLDGPEGSALAGLETDPRCYTYGSRPDTILNLGWIAAGCYAEVNSNGTLNLNADFSERATVEERAAHYAAITAWLRQTCPPPLRRALRLRAQGQDDDARFPRHRSYRYGRCVRLPPGS